ncbi:MAG: serine hydrolase domain-containing protein [Bacteroidota bacterium]
MKRLLLITLFAIAFSSLFGQAPSMLSEASPESVGVSAERLARIEKMCEETIEKEHVPGIVVLVARKGKIVLHKAFGTADIEADRRLKRDDIFRIASQTKAITSTAVMMLWEEGKFRLDDPISKYIPEFAETGVLKNYRYADTTFTTEPVNSPITIRHLLTHTSGIGYGMIDPDERFKMLYQKHGIVDAWTTEEYTIEENIKKLAKLPLHFHPGEEYLYSEGLDVLGYFIEVVSGMPFDQFLKERLFDPLGMEDSYFYLPKKKAKRLVAVHGFEDGKWQNFTDHRFDIDFPIKGAKAFFSGGGGLSSTVLDYAKFLQMYLNGGTYNGRRFLSRTTIQSIMGNHIKDYWGDGGRYYGLAFGVVDQRGQDMGGNGSIGTFEWGGYFNTQYFADPKEQVIGIIYKQTQGWNGDQTGWKFKQLVGQMIDD